MALETVELSCTAGNNTSFTSQPTIALIVIGTGVVVKVASPSKLLSATATSVAKKVAQPSHIFSVTAVSVARLLKLPGRVLSVASSHTVWLYLQRFGASRFDELICYRNWFIDEVDTTKRWVISVRQRFRYAVRGRL